jgi:hypothetical protein
MSSSDPTAINLTILDRNRLSPGLGFIYRIYFSVAVDGVGKICSLNDCAIGNSQKNNDRYNFVHR